MKKNSPSGLRIVSLCVCVALLSITGIKQAFAVTPGAITPVRQDHLIPIVDAYHPDTRTITDFDTEDPVYSGRCPATLGKLNSDHIATLLQWLRTQSPICTNWGNTESCGAISISLHPSYAVTDLDSRRCYCGGLWASSAGCGGAITYLMVPNPNPYWTHCSSCHDACRNAINYINSVRNINICRGR